MDQRTIAQIWLQWCKGCLDCPNVDLRQIKATAEPDIDLPYMESPDKWSGNQIMLLTLLKIASMFLIWLNAIKICRIIFKNSHIKYIMFYSILYPSYI